MQIIVYPHKSTKNHGCEAIIVATAKMLVGKKKELIVLDENKNDKLVLLSQYCQVRFVKATSYKRFSIDWLVCNIKKSIGISKLQIASEYAKTIIAKHLDCDVYMSIGGDNYCYGVPYSLYGFNYFLKANRKKTVLWGCSVEPDFMDKLMLEDLNRYDLIVARESITYNAMISKGVNTKIALLPDPAFTLEKTEKILPQNFLEGNTVGINVSPLIVRCEKNAGITMTNYIKLVNYILENTDMNIALIPHVTIDGNDDRVPLGKLAETFRYSDRVAIIDDHNCLELKGYIARCRFFIGARTHATIAAYSSMIPTLVVGYSVKAKGIAQDIFGEYENYVIPVQSLQQEEDLQRAFLWVYNNEQFIKQHLESTMPQYIERARSARELLVELTKCNA